MIRDYQPDWDIYTCAIDDNPAVIGLDLALRGFAPVKDKPHAIVISVYLNHPRPDGLPAGDEFALLGGIEDSLVAQLQENLDALFVGRTISNGVRDLYFYTGNPLPPDKAIADVMTNFPNYRYDFGIQEDRTWELYFDFLLPDVQEFQRIRNRKVLRTLQQYGDLAHAERPIYHRICFAAEADRDVYWQQVKLEGFRLEKDSPSNTQEYPYALHISRMDKADANSIDEVVMYLWELARELNARYEGWETSIIKPA